MQDRVRSDLADRSDFPAVFARAQAGDPSARDELIRHLRPRLLERVRFLMGEQARRQAESSDFVHEALLHLFKAWPQVHVVDSGHCVRYFAQVARHRIHDAVSARHERILEQMGSASGVDVPDQREATPSAEARRLEVRERIADALLALAEDQRQVIELRNFEHLSFAEIGRRMGRSENAVQLLHTRTMTKLGRSLRAFAS